MDDSVGVGFVQVGAFPLQIAAHRGDQVRGGARAPSRRAESAGPDGGVDVDALGTECWRNDDTRIIQFDAGLR